MAKWTTTCPTRAGWYWVRGDARGMGGSEPFLRAAHLYGMDDAKPDKIYIDGDNYKAVDAPLGGVYVAFWDEPIKTPGSFENENEYEGGKWDVIRGDTDGSFLGQVDAPTWDKAYIEARKRWDDVPFDEYNPNHELIIRPSRKKKG